MVTPSPSRPVQFRPRPPVPPARSATSSPTVTATRRCISALPEPRQARLPIWRRRSISRPAHRRRRSTLGPVLRHWLRVLARPPRSPAERSTSRPAPTPISASARAIRACWPRSASVPAPRPRPSRGHSPRTRRLPSIRPCRSRRSEPARRPTSRSALAANNLQATVDANGNLTIITSNDDASQTIGAVTSSSNLFNGKVSPPPVVDPNAQATRAGLISQYNNILSQITTTAQDSSFNGINLLNGDTLKLVFNETGTSTLSITGANFNSAGLGLSNLTVGTDFIDNNATNKVLTALQGASNLL